MTIAADERSVRPFDFRRPNKLSREHVRTLQIVQETFARGLSTTLSSALRTPANVTVESIEQRTYDEYARELPNPTHLTVLGLAPLSSAALLHLPLAIAMNVVELMLGGEGNEDQPARALSELEATLVRSLCERALPELRYAFEPVVAIEPRIAALESNPQFAQLAAPTDMVIVVSYEMKIEPVTAIASLCIPYTSLQPYLEAVSASSLHASPTEHDLTRIRQRVATLVADAPVETVARFRGVRISSRDLLGQQVGDVIPLNHPVDQPLTLEVDGVPVFDVRIGRRNRRVAVSVESPADTESPVHRPGPYHRLTPPAPSTPPAPARAGRSRRAPQPS